METWIPLTILGLCLQLSLASTSERTRGLIYEWTTSFPKCCANGKVIIKSGDLMLRVATFEAYTSKERSIRIESMYPGIQNLSCEIPESSAQGAAGIGNRKVVVLARTQWKYSPVVFVVNVTDCNLIKIETEYSQVLEHRGSFIIGNLNAPCPDDYICLKKYDDKGILVGDYGKLPSPSHWNRITLASMENTDGSLKFFVMRYPCYFSCEELSIRILNSVNDTVESRTIGYPWIQAYSTAHGNFSICFGQYGLKCKLFDHDFQPYSANTTKDISNFDGSATFVSMHNLLGGGVLVVHCSTHYLTECSMHYDVIDAEGNVRYGDIIKTDYSTGGGSPRNPHQDPENAPKIFEKDAEKRIYCIAMPYDTVKCIKIENF